jgi:hypothetical protein
MFWHPGNAKRWCEIHCTSGYDLKECKTYLDHKKNEDELVAPEVHREITVEPTPTMMNSSMKSTSSLGATFQSPPRLKERSSSERSTWPSK